MKLFFHATPPRLARGPCFWHMFIHGLAEVFGLFKLFGLETEKQANMAINDTK